MVKRTHKEIRKAILEALSDGKEHAFGNLERQVNTNWRTIRDHCHELQFFEALTISKEDKVQLTKKGTEFLKRL